MPSGPKKRRAAKRKQAEVKLVLSTAGATDSCSESMKTDVAAEVTNDDAVQLSSQQVEEHAFDEVQQSEITELVDGEDGDMPKEIGSSKSNEGIAVPEVVSSEVAVENGDIVVGAVQLASKKDDICIESFHGEGKDSPSLNGGCMFVEQVENSQGVGLNAIAPSADIEGDEMCKRFVLSPLVEQMELAKAILESFRYEHLRRSAGSLKTGVDAEVIKGDVQLSQQNEENLLDVLPSKEPPPLKKVNDAVLASLQVNEHAINKHREPVVMESVNGVAAEVSNVAVEQQFQQAEEHGFNVLPSMDPPPLMKLDKAVQVSQQVEENPSGMLLESGPMDLHNGEDAIAQSADVLDGSAVAGNFPKLLDLVEQIEHLVQEAKCLIGQQKEQM